MKALHSSETSEATHPTILHIPKDLSPQQHRSENHKSRNYAFLLLSASLVHNLFQSDFSTECDLVLALSVSSILSFPQIIQ